LGDLSFDGSIELKQALKKLDRVQCNKIPSSIRSGETFDQLNYFPFMKKTPVSGHNYVKLMCASHTISDRTNHV